MNHSAHENLKQYSNSEKLAARARLHQKYTVAEIGWFEWLAQQLPFQSSVKVLDVGCGPGWFWKSAEPWLPEHLELTLTDLSSGMVKEATERCATLPIAGVKGQMADIASLPFADNSFDLVIAMHMLYHVADQKGAIAEMHRVLKPEGTLAVTTNDTDNLKKLYELTTVFGCDPVDPAGILFGYEKAAHLMGEQFGNVTLSQYPANLRITSQDDVFMALTSYPPGDQASNEQLSAFTNKIAQRFEEYGGVLETARKSGLFLGQK